MSENSAVLFLDVCKELLNISISKDEISFESCFSMNDKRRKDFALE